MRDKNVVSQSDRRRTHRMKTTATTTTQWAKWNNEENYGNTLLLHAVCWMCMTFDSWRVPISCTRQVKNSKHTQKSNNNKIRFVSTFQYLFKWEREARAKPREMWDGEIVRARAKDGGRVGIEMQGELDGKREREWERKSKWDWERQIKIWREKERAGKRKAQWVRKEMIKLMREL